MFIAALFTIVKIWKWPSTDKWIKMFYIYIYIFFSTHTYNGILVIRNENLSFAAIWMVLENIILSEICQTKNENYCMISLICGI